MKLFVMRCATADSDAAANLPDELKVANETVAIRS